MLFAKTMKSTKKCLVPLALLFWGLHTALAQPPAPEKTPTNGTATIAAEPSKPALYSSMTTALSWLDSLASYFTTKEVRAAWANLPMEPIISVTIENLPDFLGKTLKMVEKIYPEFGAIAAIGTLSFLGGADCPGFDKASNIHLQIFPYGDAIAGLWFFRANKKSILVKSLSKAKNKLCAMSDPLEEDAQGNAWFIYGSSEAQQHLKKNLKKVAPFIYTKETPIDKLFFLDLEVNSLARLVELCPPWVRLIFRDFIQDTVKRSTTQVDFDGTKFIVEQCVQMRTASPLWNYCESMQKKLKQGHSLKWESNEPIREICFDNYVAMQTYYEALSKRAVEAEWKADEIALFLYQAGSLFGPIVRETLTFLAQNFTGNSQSYSHFQDGQDFGLWETQGLTQEKFTAFMERLCNDLVPKQLALAVEKKLPLSEFVPLLTCRFEKNTQTHQRCAIHRFSLTYNDKMPKTLYSLVFTLCNNFLLYANSVEDLKRVIERVSALEKPVFEDLTDAFWTVSMDLGTLLQSLFNIETKQDSTLTTKAFFQSKPAALIIHTEFPIFFNISMFLGLAQNISAKATASGTDAAQPTKAAETKAPEEAKSIEAK